MSPPPTPLTFRNLTSSPLILTATSSFPLPAPQVGKLTSLIARPTTVPTAAALAAAAENVTHSSLSATIPAYTSIPLPLQILPRYTRRIDFIFDGAKFRLEIPSHDRRELTVTSLSGPTDIKLTAIHHAHIPHIAIISSKDMGRWMSHLEDKTPLTSLSLPGTHNSPTYHRALPSVRCQAVPVRTQLANGIRFLDIRVQPNGGANMTLVHGLFPVSLRGPRSLSSVLNECYDFLAKNPSETIIVSLKREGRGSTDDETFAKQLREHVVGKKPERWYTKPTLPLLGEVRGKCILFRRFYLPEDMKNDGWGINAEEWQYNCTGQRYNSLCVQDFCEVLERESIVKKISYITEHLSRATEALTKQELDAESKTAGKGRSGEELLFINFLSGSNFWRTGCWPEKIARVVNPAVTEHLAVRQAMVGGRAGTGVVVLDFVGENGGWEVVRLLVGLNAGLLVRGK